MKEETMHTRPRYFWRLALPCFLGFAICLGARAQQRNGKDVQLRNDIAALKQDVAAIGAQLDQLKQLLEANAAGRLGPQPPAPPSSLVIHDEAFRGDSRATVAIVEYADFECPYCGQYAQEVYPQISKDYIDAGKVRYFFRDLPLPIHPHAMIAARAARCAGEQGKFWEMHDSLYARQTAIRDVDMPSRAQELGLDATKFSECLSSDRYADEINKNSAEAQKMGIQGTPTFFIGAAGANGEVTNLKMIVGAAPYDAFKSAIEDSLAAKTAAQR
jgi:protein-disulfide isomerase